MMVRFGSALLLAMLAIGCAEQGDRNESYGSTTPQIPRPREDGSLLANTMTPVRVGELGPSFAACNAQGAPRARAADAPIPVRAAPFDQARQTGQLPDDSRFFICTRSIDQRWFGIIYDSNGRAARACGVAAPVASRRDYSGPCESGWVASAQVRLVSGVDAQTGEAGAADQANGFSAEAK